MRIATLASATAVLGATTALLLAPRPAAAQLNFMGSFSDGSGAVTFLLTNLANNGVSTPQAIHVISTPVGFGGAGAYEAIGTVNVQNFAVQGAFISNAPGFDGTPSQGFGLTLFATSGTLTSPTGGNINGNVTYVPMPVPGPLPVLGTAAAFGISRRLRKRIQGSRTPVPTQPSA